MATAVENTGVCLAHWVPGARFFSTSDGKHMVITPDVGELPPMVVRRDTAVFYCAADSGITDLTPDFVFPPGTTAEDALTEMGYVL